ncbi:MAG TPA: fumarate hydratase, partial [Synergistaceae bacterium]|nr:fumarate hydratase [Synergistaceae bacterium]
MREIHVSVIRDEVKRLFLEAAYVLPSDVKEGLIQGARDEASDLARSVLRTIAENSTVAAEGAFPLC